MHKIRVWLGLERNIIVMLTSIVVLGMGEELWTRFLPKYLEYLGATAWIIAIYGTLKDFLDAVYQYPGGWLADRIGRRNSLILFTLLAILGYAAYMLAGSWFWILAGTVFVMAWSSLTLPALFAIIGDSLPPNRRAIGFGLQATLKRLPVIVAPVLGGWLIATRGLQRGIRIGLGATIVLGAISIYLIRRYYRETQPVSSDKSGIRNIWRNMSPNLKRLLLADCLARWAEGIPKVFVVLYVMNVLKVGSVEFGWLTALQMIASIIFYIPVAKIADRLNRKPFVLLTFAFFALFPWMVGTATSFLWIVLAFCVAGLREIGEPARKSLIVDLADPSARGRSVGLYYLIRGLAVFPASLVGGWLWIIRADLPFLAATAVGVIGCLFYAFTTGESLNRGAGGG